MTPLEMIFILCLVINILGVLSFRFGAMLSLLGLVFSIAVLLPNLVDPSIDPIIHTFMVWTMILNACFTLGSIAYRKKKAERII